MHGATHMYHDEKQFNCDLCVYIMQYDEVKESLERAIDILPEEEASLKNSIKQDIDTRSKTLYLLLGGDKEVENVSLVERKNADQTLLDRVEGIKCNTKKELAEVLHIALARSPVAEICVRKIQDGISRGLNDDIETAYMSLRTCHAVAGFCQGSAQKIAMFRPCADVLKKVVDGPTSSDICRIKKLVNEVLCCIHVLCQEENVSRETQPQRHRFTDWSASCTTSLPEWRTRASNVCKDVIDIAARIEVYEKLSGPLSRHVGMMENCASGLSYSVGMLSPFASLGLLISGMTLDISSMSDTEKKIYLLQYSACVKQGFQVQIAGIEAQVYLLFIKASDHAVSVARSLGDESLAIKIAGSSSQSLPPVSITDWLTSHPPSATIQALLHAKESGLAEISNYLMYSSSSKEKTALAMISGKEILGEEEFAQHMKGVGEPDAIDDLLFFESTEGQLNMLPEDWDDGDDDPEVDMGNDGEGPVDRSNFTVRLADDRQSSGE